MTLVDLISNLPKNWWVDKLIDLNKEKISFEFTKEEIKNIFEGISKSFEKGQVGRAASWLCLGILTNKERTFNYIRRKGVFRYSKYVDTSEIVSKVTDIILKSADEIGIDGDDLRYIQSIRNMHIFYGAFKNIKSRLIAKLKERERKAKTIEGLKTSIIKELLVFSDFLFLKGYVPIKNKQDPNELEYYSKEQITEAISFLIFLYGENIGINKRSHGLIDESYVLSEDMQNLILDACIYKELLEYEIYIDHFSYICLLDRNNLSIKSTNEELEKSIQLGFIRTFLQRYYLFNESMEHANNILSFQNLAEELYKSTDDTLFKLVEEGGITRYRVEAQTYIYKVLYNDDRLFREEMLYLSQLFKEQFLSSDNLSSIIIKNSLSLFDFLKIRRIFSFMFFIFSEKINNEAGENVELLLRSLIPIFKKDYLIGILHEITGDNKGELFLDIMCWGNNTDTILDLQYQPIFQIQNYYLLPLCIVHMSDAIRNLYVSQYRQNNSGLLNDGEFDPIVDLLTKAFESKKFLVRSNIKYKYDHEGSDIDFLAVRDGELFIIECKNPILPANIYELRTGYDYIVKANVQLDLSKRALSDNEFRKEFGESIHLNLGDIQGINTCIVMGNRLFSGLNCFSHPIRYVYELLNVVETGVLSAEEGTFCTWKSENFSVLDLKEYLDDNISLIRIFYDSMVSSEVTYELGDYSLSFESYALEQPKVEELFRKKNFRRLENDSIEK